MLCNRAIRLLTHNVRVPTLCLSKQQCLFTATASPDRSKDFFNTSQASILTHPSHVEAQDVTHKSDGVMGIMETCHNWTTGETRNSNTQQILDKICTSVANNPRLMNKAIAEQLTNAITNPKICVVHCDKQRLRDVTLGDAGFVVVRNNSVIFQSQRRSFLFNEVPVLKEPHDVTQHAYHTEIELQSGDIVIMGSDGLFDNLYMEDIEQIISRSSKEELASNLAGSAMAAGCSTRKMTPFSERVNEETGQLWNGGKPDDVAVVVTASQ